MSTPNRSSAETSKERSYVTSSSIEARDSSETTTVPQLSSSISDNSSSENNNIRALRQQLHLVRVQLEQREKELSKYEFISKTEDVHSKKWKEENKIQMRRANALEEICTNLLNCLEASEIAEKEKLDSIASMYSKHVEQLAHETTALKQHNASLQQQLSDACAKMTAIDNENKYIRWENDNYKKEMESLKMRVNEEKHDLVALKSELRLIKKTNEDLRLAQCARLTEEIGSAVSKKNAINESLRRILKDREKEYGINLSRMHNEIDFLKGELDRKEELCKRFTRMLDKLTKDNQQLFDEIADIRSAREQEVDKLNDALVRAEHEICKVRDSERILRGTVRQLEQVVEADRSSHECLIDVRQKLIISSRNEQLDKANATIASLQKQVENLLAVQKIGTHYALVKSLKEKTLLVANLEENIRRLHVELEKEKEQRENSTTLLIEMGRDMRHLLALVNDSD